MPRPDTFKETRPKDDIGRRLREAILKHDGRTSRDGEYIGQLSLATTISVEHLYAVATGRRKLSRFSADRVEAALAKG